MNAEAEPDTEGTLHDGLPDFLRGLLPAFFDSPRPRERHATCDDCAMCPDETQARDELRVFSPNTKCCTFHPTLPNYAVGGLLADPVLAGTEGRRRIADRVRSRVGVSPRGLRPPADYQRIMVEPDLLGQSEKLLCPFYDDGSCSVWAYRESTCSTYFCKHVGGRDGARFWWALRTYLRGVERALYHHALLELGFSAEWLLEEQVPAPAEVAREYDRRPPSEAHWRAMWGPWAGRELELFEQSWRVVGALDPARLAHAGGVELELLLKRVEDRYASLTRPQIPERLRRSDSLQVHRDPAGGALLVGYSPTDPLRVSGQVLEMIDAFDGRLAVAETLEQLRLAHGTAPGPALMLRLWQHGILERAG